jgi:hypothetical protein
VNSRATLVLLEVTRGRGVRTTDAGVTLRGARLEVRTTSLEEEALLRVSLDWTEGRTLRVAERLFDLVADEVLSLT